MKVSSKKTTIAKFGVTLQPSKTYDATKEEDRYHVKVEDKIYVIFEESELNFVSPIEIILSGGCVQSVSNPSDSEIIIRDYDIDEEDAKGNPNALQDEDGDWYQNMVFPPKSGLD